MNTLFSYPRKYNFYIRQYKQSDDKVNPRLKPKNTYKSYNDEYTKNGQHMRDDTHHTHKG